MNDVIICGGTVAACRRVRYCPTCERRRRFVQSHAGLYYDDLFTCLGCGDTWCGGERGERPFRRGWRLEALTRARAQWAAAMSRKDFRAFVHEEITTEMRAWNPNPNPNPNVDVDVEGQHVAGGAPAHHVPS